MWIKRFLTSLLILLPMCSLQAQRIVSLAPNVTETLCALGLENEIVGRSDYCDYPESVQSIPSIGTLWTPSVERIITLRPTLVIASSLIDDSLLNALKKAKIKTLEVNRQEHYEGTYSMITEIGKAVGKEKQAEALVKSMQDKTQTIIKRYQGSPKPSIYIALDFGSYDSAATGDTFLGEMILMAGGANAAQDGKRWVFSKEKLVESDPDIIILPQEGTRKVLDEWKTTKPYCDLKGKAYTIDANLLNRQGPRSADALEELARIIHQ